MFTANLHDGATTIPLYHAKTELDNLVRLEKPIPAEFYNANSIRVPSGEEPARAWVLCRREDLDSLNLNALQKLTFTYTDEKTHVVETREFKALVICKEPLCLTPSNTASDPDAAYLVELADSRWRVHNPHFSVPINKLYNVSSNVAGSAPTDFLTSSMRSAAITGATNATPIVVTSNGHRLSTGDTVIVEGVEGNTAANGTWEITVVNDDTFSLDTSVGSGSYTTGGTWYSRWTWDEMVGSIWGHMSTQIGTYDELPIEPDGYPTGWIFQGKSAWKALCEVLRRIGCTVKPDLSQDAGSQFTIVQVGDEDATLDAALDAADAENRKVHDCDYQTIVRGKVPYGVRVHFHKQHEEPTAIPPWLENLAPYTVDKVGPDAGAGAESGIYHPLWDDMPAIYDDTETLTNSSALNDRAQERADDYYRMLREEGGGRYVRRYAGLLDLVPGSTVDYVWWSADSSNGIFTDVLRQPPPPSLKDDYADGGTVQDLVRLGFPATVIEWSETTPGILTTGYQVGVGWKVTTHGDSVVPDDTGGNGAWVVTGRGVDDVVSNWHAGIQECFVASYAPFGGLRAVVWGGLGGTVDLCLSTQLPRKTTQADCIVSITQPDRLGSLRPVDFVFVAPSGAGGATTTDATGVPVAVPFTEQFEVDDTSDFTTDDIVIITYESFAEELIHMYGTVATIVDGTHVDIIIDSVQRGTAGADIPAGAVIQIVDYLQGMSMFAYYTEDDGDWDGDPPETQQQFNERIRAAVAGLLGTPIP